MLLLLLLFVPTTVTALPVLPATRKQGFSGYLNVYSCDDQKALGLSDSWYYTWTKDSCQHCGGRNPKCKPAQQGVEFVPMINGIGQLFNGINPRIKLKWTTANVHYLLGYNEPDPGHHPHEAAPRDAAKDWV